MLDESKTIVRTGFRTLNIGLNAINTGLDAINEGILEPVNREVKEFSEENKEKHKANMAYLKSDEFKKTIKNEVYYEQINEEVEKLKTLNERLENEESEYMQKSIKALIKSEENMINFLLKKLEE